MRTNSNLLRTSFTYNGRRYEVYAETKKELAEKKADKLAALKRGEVLIASNMLVSVWAAKCVDTYKTNLSPKAFNDYKYCMQHYVLEEIGNMRLKDVKPLTCQMCLNKLDGLSSRTINFAYQIMNFIFQKAVDNELINKNPAKNVIKPKGTKQTRRALTAHEEAIFLKVAPQHKYGLYFMLMYGCSCRPNEAASVEGRDISYQDGKPILHIRGTKSKAADRYVPIPAEVMALMPEKLEPFKLLCTTGGGSKINDTSRKRAWNSLTRMMNIEMGCRVYRNELIPPLPLADDLCPYCLRHTYCTNLQKRGVDIRTAQRLMGHTDIALTANIYTHVSQEKIIEDYDIITGNCSASKVVQIG